MSLLDPNNDGCHLGWRVVDAINALNIEAITKDPRVVGCVTALLWMLFDDLPGEPYSTFRDPGAAAMQSIIFGEFAALAVLRGWDTASSRWFVAALLFKLLFQGAFYVRNAGPIDLLTLFAAHLLVSTLAGKECSVLPGLMRCGAALAGCLVAFTLCVGVYRYCEFWQRDANFWSFAAARVAFPLCFWSSLTLLPNGVLHWKELSPEPSLAGAASTGRAISFRQLMKRHQLSITLLALAAILFLGGWRLWAQERHHKELLAYARAAAIRQPLQQYAQEHGGKFPLTWEELPPSSLPPELRRFHDMRTQEDLDWIYFGGYSLGEHSRQSQGLLIILISPRSVLGGRVAVFTDGSAGLVAEPDLVQRLSEQLAERK